MGFLNRNIGGTAVQSTSAPSNTSQLWVDVSSGTPVAKVYNVQLDQWVSVGG